jgi:serine/threonine-protein kinase RsbW
MRFESDPANIGVARRAIEAFACGCGFDDRSSGEMGLCLNEALANIVRHAYHGAEDQPIALVLRCDGESLQVTIRDWGAGDDPEAGPEKAHNPLCPGGLGLICMREMMDQVLFSPQPDGMLLTMIRSKSRPPRGMSKAG